MLLRLLKAKDGLAVFAVSLVLLTPGTAALATTGPQTTGPQTTDNKIKLAERDRAVLDQRDLSRIQAVITDQLAAFAADDAESAFAHASPVIQRRFGNADRFIAMVKSGYAPLLTPRMVSFDQASKGDGEKEIIQPVTLLAPSGVLMTAIYRMVEVGGEWRIAGCVLRKSPDKAI
ncbi:MAG: DUF4864 domain-containing protein [Pseudomonadota bacterium]